MELNKIYSGFRLDRIERIDEINGTAYEMKHEKSGARLIYIDSPDTNKVFNIAFRTTPQDSTGVAHIMEHSVLCGSRKFPLKEPFVELVKGSLNTFFRYGVPIHVRSTFSNNTGTIIREDYTVESNKHVITGVADDTNTAKVALVGVENKPGIAAKVFKALAGKNVDVDMIVQSIRSVGEPKTDLIFTIALDDVVLAREVLKELQQTVDIEAVNIDENMAKVSIIGAGMLGQPGVAAQMFDILSKEGINIEIISTSEISISCLVAQNRVKDAVRVIHNGLLLNERG